MSYVSYKAPSIRSTQARSLLIVTLEEARNYCDDSRRCGPTQCRMISSTVTRVLAPPPGGQPGGQSVEAIAGAKIE